MKPKSANSSIKTELENCLSLKPENLVIDDLKWKYLCRSVLRGKNILLVGPTGCGKTLAAHSVASAYVKPENFFSFNLGSTQDPRSSLIGNTHFDKSTGTVFNESTFVTAIRTPKSVILLDELSRAHPESWNILLPVLDELQRYLRLDESKDCEVVKVAPGVTFIATANIGNEYTSTKIMDRALLNRFSVKIEMNALKEEAEFNLLKSRFLIPKEQLDSLRNLVKISAHTRLASRMEDARLSNSLSTRDMVESAELLVDGFSLTEIAENVIYPNFDDSGGTDSERTYVRQLIQRFVTTVDVPTTLFSPKTLTDKMDGAPPF